MTVYAPVCADHRSHWFKRKLIGWLLVLGGIVAFFGGIFILIALEKNQQFRDIATWAPLLGALGFLIALIVAAIVFRSAIRPLEITDDDIRLTGVDAEFVAALKDQRRAEREERAQRRKIRNSDY